MLDYWSRPLNDKYTYEDIVYLRQSRYHYKKYGIYMWRTKSSYDEYNQYLKNYLRFSHFVPDSILPCYLQADKIYNILNYPICMPTEEALGIVNNKNYIDLHKECFHDRKKCLIIDEYINRFNKFTNEEEWSENAIEETFDTIKKYNRCTYFHGADNYFDDLTILQNDKIKANNKSFIIGSFQYFYNYLLHKTFDFSDWGDHSNGVLYDLRRRTNFRLYSYYGTTEDIEFYKSRSKNYEEHGIWAYHKESYSEWLEDNYHMKEWYGNADSMPELSNTCGVSLSSEHFDHEYLLSIGIRTDDDPFNPEFKIK